MLVRASQLRGVMLTEAEGEPLTGPISLAGPPAANVLVTPRSLTRELAGPGGSCSETLLVPERLPGLVLQWSGWSPDEGWPLEVHLLVDQPERIRCEGGTLRIARDSTADASDGELETPGVVIHLSQATDGAPRIDGRDNAGIGQPSAGHATAGAPHGEGTSAPPLWEWTAGPDGVVARTRVRCTPTTPVTLLVHAIEPVRRLPSLAALAAVAAHRTRDDLEPVEAEGLRLGTGVAELDDGVGWARAALRSLLEESGGAQRLRLLDLLPLEQVAGQPGDEAALLARGALAAGEWQVAEAALQTRPASLDDAAALASWVEWTSRAELFTAHVDALAELAGRAPADLRQRLVDAAEAAGVEGFADRIAPASRARRLPTVSAVPAPEAAGRQVAADGAAADRAAGALTTADRAAAGPTPPAEAFLDLRSRLGALLREGASPGGLDAAAALERLVHGLLGARPDAAFGRLSLRPRLPAHWTSFEFGGLRLGDATVGVRYDRTDDQIEWRLRQTAGGAPITWLFTVTLDGRSVAHVEVDGTPAEIDLRTTSEGDTFFDIQLPAERERVLNVRLTPQ